MMCFRQMSKLMISSWNRCYENTYITVWCYFKWCDMVAFKTLHQSGVQGNLVWGVDPFLSICHVHVWSSRNYYLPGGTPNCISDIVLAVRDNHRAFERKSSELFYASLPSHINFWACHGALFQKNFNVAFCNQTLNALSPLCSPIMTETDTKLGRKSHFNATIWKFLPPHLEICKSCRIFEKYAG